jgi:hypothetical protein
MHQNSHTIAASAPSQEVCLLYPGPMNNTRIKWKPCILSHVLGDKKCRIWEKSSKLSVWLTMFCSFPNKINVLFLCPPPPSRPNSTSYPDIPAIRSRQHLYPNSQDSQLDSHPDPDPGAVFLVTRINMNWGARTVTVCVNFRLRVVGGVRLSQPEDASAPTSFPRQNEPTHV